MTSSSGGDKPVPQADLRYGDLCQRCNAASGIDTCPVLDGKCPLDVGGKLPKNYYKQRKEQS